jgi:hypothetical protein
MYDPRRPNFPARKGAAAIRERNRHAFLYPPGISASMTWLVQDEREDFKGGYLVNGSAAYGTERK